LVDNIDGFMTEMVKEWMSDNQVAIESGMKVEMVSSFIDGLKNLFSEHYVDVPEEKLDVVAEQAQELEELAQISNTLVEENEALQAELASLKSALVFESVCEDLTDVQVEKFKGLVENVEFSTVEDYQDKLETLKEAYFPMGQTTETKLTEDTAQGVDESMSKYVAAVSKNLKF
jgi:regulator of replication initiation timing